MKKLRTWLSHSPDRRKILTLLLLCIILMGLCGLFLIQRNQAWDGEKQRGGQLLSAFQSDMNQAWRLEANRIVTEGNDDPYHVGETISRFFTLANSAQRLGEVGVLSETDAALYQAFFMMYYEGMRQEIPEQDMWKLVEIAQSEPEFWERARRLTNLPPFSGTATRWITPPIRRLPMGRPCGRISPKSPRKQTVIPQGYRFHEKARPLFKKGPGSPYVSKVPKKRRFFLHDAKGMGDFLPGEPWGIIKNGRCSFLKPSGIKSEVFGMGENTRGGASRLYRRLVGVLLVFCVLLLGTGVYLLAQQDSADGQNRPQQELLLSHFRDDIVMMGQTGIQASLNGEAIGELQDVKFHLHALADYATELGEAGVLSKEDSLLYRDFFSMYVSLLEYGDNADVPREDMEKLIHIAQQEEEFWENGAPFDEFAAFFQEGHQLKLRERRRGAL